MTSLTVVVPTYNRVALLEKTLLSLLAADRPTDLDISILVVDNNSRDATHELVERIAASATLPVRYLLETRQSSSFARNAGILATHTDLLGFIDDDEEVEQHWFHAVAREFADSNLDFIGGPYFAGSEVALPAWIPPDYPAVIGIQQPRPRGTFGADFSGNLNSGNSVFRRSVFDRVGLYAPDLGRSGKGLLSEEDAELYARIRALGLHGVFVPELIIFHHIAPERLTRHYYRRWCFWRGVSQGLLARRTQHEPVPHLLGIPRYQFGRAATALRQLASPSTLRHPAQRFNNELRLWDLLGLLYGRLFARSRTLYQPVNS